MILVFAAFYLPHKGGYAIYLHDLAKYLAARGYKVVVFACNTNKSFTEEIIDGVRVVRVDSWLPRWLNYAFPIPKPLAVLKALRNLKDNRISIIITNARFYPITFVGFFLAKFKGVPVIMREVGGRHAVGDNWFITKIGEFIDHTGGWMICRFSDKVVGICDAACQFTQHIGARNPIKIFEGVELDFWKRDHTYDIRDKIYITVVARLIYAKGIQDLLKSVQQLKNKLDDLIFSKIVINIVGDGNYRSKLEQLSQDLELTDKTVFWGELDLDGVKQVLFDRTTIVVQTSYSEGLPGSVLEGAAAALPMVLTDTGGTRDIVPTTEQGFLVEPGNIKQLAEKLEILIKDSNLRKTMGQNARSYMEKNFNWQAIVDDYEKLFANLLNK